MRQYRLRLLYQWVYHCPKMMGKICKRQLKVRGEMGHVFYFFCIAFTNLSLGYVNSVCKNAHRTALTSLILPPILHLLLRSSHAHSRVLTSRDLQDLVVR
jgi:hypothetical protein